MGGRDDVDTARAGACYGGSHWLQNLPPIRSKDHNHAPPRRRAADAAAAAATALVAEAPPLPHALYEPFDRVAVVRAIEENNPAPPFSATRPLPTARVGLVDADGFEPADRDTAARVCGHFYFWQPEKLHGGFRKPRVRSSCRGQSQLPTSGARFCDVQPHAAPLCGGLEYCERSRVLLGRGHRHAAPAGTLKLPQ